MWKTRKAPNHSGRGAPLRGPSVWCCWQGCCLPSKPNPPGPGAAWLSLRSIAVQPTRPGPTATPNRSSSGLSPPWGARILTAETEEDFAQALDMQGPDDEIEAPAEVMEAFGIQSDESLGIEAEAS